METLHECAIFLIGLGIGFVGGALAMWLARKFHDATK